MYYVGANAAFVIFLFVVNSGNTCSTHL